MKTLWKALAQAPLALIYVGLVVLQRHRMARIGATLTLLCALVGTFAFARG